MEKKISLKGLNKADVLAALYNAAKPQGMGFLHYDSKPMTREEAEALLKQTTYFDYLKGRVLKVDLSGDELDPWKYDRDNGQGAAERVITEIRVKGDVNSSIIQTTHQVNMQESAKDAKEQLNKESHLEITGDVAVLKLGLSDAADKLGPAIDKAIKSSEKSIKKRRA